MMNVTQSTAGNMSGKGGSEEKREFPSFRLVDTVSASSQSRAFAPLRFTLDPSKWNSGHARPQFVRPTLISPPGSQSNGSESTLKAVGDAPLFPAMESSKNNLKRPASEVPPTSFLPYKKKAISLTISDDLEDSSMHRSPEYLQNLVENEPHMKEAASILLDMRTLVAVNETSGIQSVPGNVSQTSTVASVMTDGTRMSLAETPTNLPEDQLAAEKTSTTRTVTPAPSGMRLAFPEDAHELNSLHCFVRAELLEVFALPGASDEATSSNQGIAQSRSTRRNGTSTKVGRRCSGRVGLRCVYCAHLPRRARTGSTMSSFYPKSLSDIYRSVCTWQRIHFRSCRHIPPQVREGYWQLKDSDRTRGKTRYWVSSAKRLGLVDVDSERGGICFATTPPPSHS